MFWKRGMENSKEEFRAKMVEWGELYIEYREKNEDMDENLNQE